MKILIVEDKLEHLQVCLPTLKHQNSVEIVNSYKKGEILALSHQFDFILMSESLCDEKRIKAMRSKGFLAPIVVLTFEMINHKSVWFLDHGIDDIFSYHMDSHLMISRMNALMRRLNLEYESVYKLGEILFEPQSGLLKNELYTLSLTKKETDLMKYLYLNQNIALSKEKLRRVIWGNKPCEENNIEVYISFLRKKLKKLDRNVKIETKRNIGYMLTNISEGVMRRM
ncbi:MAG: response regulator transcription factor [Clostridia bacterium]|nr:response regulator transcription factor [Clostridia bacterium]